MIITALLLAGAVDAEEAGLSRASGISLAPAAARYHLEIEIREDGALIASPSLVVREGETARLAVGGPDGYRIELSAEPSPAGWYAPQAADDVFVSSRLFLAGGGDWRRVGDAMVAIEPGSEAQTAFDLSGAGYARAGETAPLGEISVSYRMTRPAS